jgi:membrane protease YdiL (CAAX protease family)
LNKILIDIKILKNISIFVCFYIVSLAFFQLISFIIIKYDYETAKIQGLNLLQQLVISMFGLFGLFSSLYFYLKSFENKNIVSCGFKSQHMTKNLFNGIILGLFLITVGFFYLYFTNEISITKISLCLKKIVIIIIFFSVVSIHEETLLRGFFLNKLNASLGKNNALFFSSLLFSIMHVFNPNFTILSFVNIFLAGILLGIPYLRTGNLWFSIGLHFSWNLFQSLFGFNVSGKKLYSIFELKLSNKKIIYGGDFGFEGSIVCFFVECISIILIITYFNSNYSKNIK